MPPEPQSPQPRPSKWRRLWRRRLRRRPLLPFLLAATLAVDTLLLWVGETRSSIDTAIFAFIAAQLGLLGIWATHSVRGLLPRIGIVVLLVITALILSGCLPFWKPSHPSLSGGPFVDISPMAQAIVMTTAAVTTVAAGAVHLLFRRWRRQSFGRRSRRYSISSVLWLMLIVALLLGLGRYGDWKWLAGAPAAIFVLAEAAPTGIMLAIAKYCRKETWRFLLLVAAPLAVVIGYMPMVHGTPQDAFHLFLYYGMECFFIGAWLWLTGDAFSVKGRKRTSSLSAAQPVERIDLTA